MKTKFFPFPVLAVFAVFLFSACFTMPNQSFISVNATGTVRAEPDTAHMVISLSDTAATSAQARDNVNAGVREVLAILRETGIEDSNISTASLQFRPDYDWGPQGRVFRGQRVEQSMSFTIDNINYDDEIIPNIIDRLIHVNGFQLHGLNFSIRDKTELMTKARELGYQKALEQALQLAELSGQSIIRVSTISYHPAVHGGHVIWGAPRMDAAAGGPVSSVVPVGELEISASVFVSFLAR